jgi:hypothetical protein
VGNKSPVQLNNVTAFRSRCRKETKKDRAITCMVEGVDHCEDAAETGNGVERYDVLDAVLANDHHNVVLFDAVTS